MKLDSTFIISANLKYREVGQETVMIDLASGIYFGLDAVGTRIWRLLRHGKSLGQVCDIMVEQYEVPREELEQDVIELVLELIDKKLVSIASSAAYR